MFSRLQTIERRLARLEGWFIVALLSEMVVLTFAQVLLRNLHIHALIQQANILLGQIDWADPLVRLSVLWLSFLGASMVTGENRHIKIDLLTGVFPLAWQPLREAVVSIVSALICGIMFGASLEHVSMEYHAGGALFLGIPSWVMQLILPIGFLLILMKFLVRATVEIGALARGSKR